MVGLRRSFRRIGLTGAPTGADNGNMKNDPRSILARLAVAVSLGFGFMLMSSIFVPEPILAGSAPNGLLGPSTDPHAGLLSLGELTGRRHRVVIYQGRTAPLYSIYDERGEPLATLLTEERVAELFPEIPLRATDFSAPSGEMLMLAEPAELHAR
jgi:hypothetical protein